MTSRHRLILWLGTAALVAVWLFPPSLVFVPRWTPAAYGVGPLVPPHDVNAGFRFVGDNFRLEGCVRPDWNLLALETAIVVLLTAVALVTSPRSHA